MAAGSRLILKLPKKIVSDVVGVAVESVFESLTLFLVMVLESTSETSVSDVVASSFDEVADRLEALPFLTFWELT